MSSDSLAHSPHTSKPLFKFDSKSFFFYSRKSLDLEETLDFEETLETLDLFERPDPPIMAAVAALF